MPPPASDRSESNILDRMNLRVGPDSGQPTEAPPDLKSETHRSRLALHRVLADPADATAWGTLATTYDDMASGWGAWADAQPLYLQPLVAGLTRARSVPWLVEVACGTGQATRLLDAHAPLVLATDVNRTMLRRAPLLANTRYFVADVRQLPVASRSVPMLVGLNGVPHVPEFQRVLGPGSQLLWCTSFGNGTPLYLAPERIAALFGPGWEGETGRTGHGDWLLLTRSR
jgi:SAM-dependent methyltransferase